MALVRTENQQLCELVLELNERLQDKKEQKTNLGEIYVKDKKITTPSSATPSTSSATATTTHGILDLSISREVSMRFDELHHDPGTNLSGNRDNGPVARPKYRPRSSTSSRDAKSVHAKGKMAFKHNMQQKRLLQHHHSLIQQQLQQQQKQQQQQLHQQQQLRLQQHDHNFGVMSTSTAVTTVGGEDILCSPLFLNRAATSPTSTTTPLGPSVDPRDPLFALAPSPAPIESPLRTVHPGKKISLHFQFFFSPSAGLLDGRLDRTRLLRNYLLFLDYTKRPMSPFGPL